jgi:hypothetical protein
MAKSLAQALVASGRVRPEDTQEARLDAEWRARQKRESEAVAARIAEPPPRARWEAEATGKIVETARADVAVEEVVCSDCGELFDPSAAEHKRYGKSDRCGPCAQTAEPGPRRKRGQMVWTHKTAPTLEIEGGQKLGPEELAAMRRR